jgi:hypothetical protein
VIGIVAGVVALWCLLSLPIGLVVGRSMGIGTRFESRRRLLGPLQPLRSVQSR